MFAYRIADGRRPLFDGTGAMLNGGRWNSPGRPVIYATETFANAMLEVLAHSNLSLVPKHHAFIRIDIPDTVVIQDIPPSQLPKWPHTPEHLCRKLGDAWLDSRSTAVLRVPSIVTSGHERNLVINPTHPAFLKIKAKPPEPVLWDPRLFPPKR
jgi:RES domain-containing protein